MISPWKQRSIYLKFAPFLNNSLNLTEPAYVVLYFPSVALECALQICFKLLF